MNNKLMMQFKITGEGKPLLLVPGGLTGWQSWEPFVEIFSAKQRKVIRVQLLNVQYGIEGRKLPEDYSVKTESGALKEALSSESVQISEPIDIVAWSYGALTALDYALDHPERIRTLALIEPPAIWVLHNDKDSGLDENGQKTMKFFETLNSDITEDILEEFLLDVGFVSPGESARTLPQWNQWLPFRQSLRNSPAVVYHRDALSRLKNIQQPVLLVKGTGSAKFLHNVIDRLAENLPKSRVVELPAGHAPHIVSREKFLLVLENFQQDLD